jgi:2-polyprenyl-3-methyl-5-hydroxy-6-metoxy-1,4-benzoquinol methylase
MPPSAVTNAEWRAAALQMWSAALTLDGHPTLLDSVVAEAAEYFGLTRCEVRFRMEHGTRLLAEEWEGMRLRPDSEEDLIRFYNENTAEPFELLEFNANGDAGYNYVAALEVARSKPGRMYLDYGSGVGSGAVFFARQGFTVTLADVSTPLLRFAEWRLRKRGIAARCIDLKEQSLPCGQFDIITAFDVLEHLLDPLRVIEDLRESLTPGGVLCFNAPFGHDPDRPMHIFHDERILRHLRAAGFARSYGARAAIHALVKVPNPLYRRWFFRLYDDHLQALTRRIDTGAIRRRLRWRTEP